MSFTSPILLAVIAVTTIAIVLVGCTGRQNLRPYEPGFRYVHMNQDGTFRELSPVEQSIFGQTYLPGDDNAPVIKAKHDQRDGWGSLSGYIDRRRVPPGISIQPVNPGYSPTQLTPEFLMRLHESSGYRVTKTAEGFKIEPGSHNPQDSMRRFTELWLEHERADEARARPIPH